MVTCEATVRRARPADAAGIARVHVATWRDTYPGVLPAPFLVALSAEAEERRWRSRLARPVLGSTTFVADDPRAGIVGYAICGANRRPLLVKIDAEVYEIYVDPWAQGRHLGRRLVAAMAGRLLVQGFRSACIRVLRDNPTRWFYRHLNGRLILEETIRFAGADLAQLTYVWPDIGSLQRLAGEADDAA